MLSRKFEDFMTESTSSLKSISQSLGSIDLKFIEFQSKLVNSLNDNILLLSHRGFWDKYGDALSGFIGVLVGGMITYFIQRKLNTEASLGRFAVQRKNLIYAKFYKEIKELQNYLIEESDLCYICIVKSENTREDQSLIENGYYLGNHRRKYPGKFLMWANVKNDIRKTYISLKIQKMLDDVENSIDIYKSEREKLILDFNNIYKESFFYRKSIKTDVGNIQTIDSPYFKENLFIRPDPVKKIFEIHIGWADLLPKETEDSAIFREEVRKLEVKLNTIKFSPMWDSYDNLVRNIKILANELERLITYINNKFEYGKQLEKYDF